MERKYFAFKNDYKIQSSYLREPIVIPAHQPLLVDRILDEYGYCFLIKQLTSETSLNMGYFKDEISKDEEINMWKLIASYAESSLHGWFDSDLRNDNRRDKKIQDMHILISKQDEIINGLKTALSYCDGKNY